MIEKARVRFGTRGPIGGLPAFLRPPKHGSLLVGECDSELESSHFDVAFEAALSKEPIERRLGGAALAAGLSAEQGPAEGADAFVALGGEPSDVKADEIFEFIFFNGVGLEGPAIGESDGDLATGTIAEKCTFAWSEPGIRFASEAGQRADAIFPIRWIHTGIHLTFGGKFSDFVSVCRASDE